jgi:hypothetical protein
MARTWLNAQAITCRKRADWRCTAGSKIEWRFFSVSHGDPELCHAYSPGSARAESRWVLGTPHAPRAPRDKPRKLPQRKHFCTHWWVLSPTGGSDYPPAVAQRAFRLISGFFSRGKNYISLHSIESRHARLNRTHLSHGDELARR